MKFLNLRTRFVNKFLIDGKKYNAFMILNNIFQFLNFQNKHNYQIFNNFFLIIEPLFYIEKIVSMSQLMQYILFLPKKKKKKVILNLLKKLNKKKKKKKIYFLKKFFY